MEESRTNLFTYSEELSQKDQNMTTTDNAAIAPTGEQTASLCIPTNSNSEHYIDDAAVTSGVDYVMSCFAKYGSGTYLLAFRGAGIGNNPPRFDLATGTIENNSPSDKWSNLKMEAVGNGWYRCSAVATPNSTSPLRFQLVSSTGGASYVGDGTGHYLWGLQIEEAGSFPTSYIKTTGSTATRSADVASIPVADFGYNQSAFTVSIEASHLYDTFPSFNRFWELSGGGDTVGLYGNSGSSSYVSMTVGGVSQVSFSDGAEAAANANTFMKYAVGLKTNDFDIARDGSLDAGDTSIIMPDAIDTLAVGRALNGSAQLNGHIKSIKYYPRRLTNVQLQDLTS